VLGGLHHEYVLVPALARSGNRGAQAFFDGKTLLDRREIVVGGTQQIGSIPLYRASPKMCNGAVVVPDGNTLCEM
jgi:hypothetical protein